ncbi:MAG: hypothetical protein ACREE6_17265, partial [Limisphaerales bacterium]
LVAGDKAASETEMTSAIVAAGFKIISSSLTMGEKAAFMEMTCEVTWRARHDDTAQPLAFLKEIAGRFGLAKIDWHPADKTLR